MTITLTPKLGFYKGALGDGPYETEHNLAADNLEERLAGSHAGDPNGFVKGWFLGQEVMDTVNNTKYYSTLIGEAAAAQWTPFPRLGSNAWIGSQLFIDQHTLFFWDSNDPGYGPVLDIMRKRTTPANNTVGGAIRFRESAIGGAEEVIYEVLPGLIDAAPISLSSRVLHRTRWAGGFTDPLVLGPGVLVGGGTPGGMPLEPGVLNVAGLQVNGIPVHLPQCAHMEAHGSSGSDGPTPDGATWQPYPFNVERADSGNILDMGIMPYFQLIDGLYMIQWTVSFYNGIGRFGTRLQRGDAVTLARGTNGTAAAGEVGVSSGCCAIRVTGGFAVFGIEYRCKDVSGGKLGKAINEEPECYGVASFTKIAS